MDKLEKKISGLARQKEEIESITEDGALDQTGSGINTKFKKEMNCASQHQRKCKSERRPESLKLPEARKQGNILYSCRQIRMVRLLLPEIKRLREYNRSKRM